MPIYMIMPRYSHNYALFYQLLDGNLFTHRNTYAILREATSETYGPRVYLLSYKFPLYFILQSLLSIYIIKIPKIFILLLSLSDLTLVSDREGIDSPYITLVARFLIFCAGTRRFACSLLLDWYLGSQKLREILTLLCCITLSSSRENQRNAQELARRISGAVVGESTQPSTHHKLLSLALHYLPFASRFPLPHFTFAFSSPSSRMSFCLCFHVPSICLHLCFLKIY